MHTYIRTSTPSYQPLPLTHTLSHAVSVWDSCCSQSYSHTQTGFVQMENTHTHTPAQSVVILFSWAPPLHSLETCLPSTFMLSTSRRQTGYFLWVHLPPSFICSLLIWISALIITAPCFWPRHSPGNTRLSLCNTQNGPRNESKAECQGVSVPSFYFLLREEGGCPSCEFKQ